MEADLAADQEDAGRPVSQPRHVLPLRPSANLLTALLISTITFTAGTLALPLFDPGDSPWEVSYDARPLVILSRITATATMIAFLIWFRRARDNAESQGRRQRLPPAATFWGWIVPVVNLWLPLLIMDDIWRANYPRFQRTWTAWLPMLWWTSWLLAEAPALGIWHGRPSDFPDHVPAYLPQSWPAMGAFAAAGLTLITIIRAVSKWAAGTPATPDQGEHDNTKQLL